MWVGIAANLIVIILILLWIKDKIEDLSTTIYKQGTIIEDPVLKDKFLQLSKDIDKIPYRTLDSITSSTNTNKGKLAELIGYIDLRAKYDRLFPLGGITDFVAIRFGTDEVPGELVFIDVKNGKKAVLSNDQKALKKIIESGNIKFLKIDITTEVISDYLPAGNTPVLPLSQETSVPEHISTET